MTLEDLILIAGDYQDICEDIWLFYHANFPNYYLPNILTNEIQWKYQ